MHASDRGFLTPRLIPDEELDGAYPAWARALSSSYWAPAPVAARAAELLVVPFDAIYLFNPFEENLCAPSERLDDTVDLSEARFKDDVRCAEELLVRARVGTRVVTYHGFGGAMPRDWHHEKREWQRSAYLDLWVKRGPERPPRVSS
jgi:hypothetical protein